MIFDTHVHYDDRQFDDDRELLLNSLSSEGVGMVVDICAAMRDLDRVIALAERYPFMYAAVGVHPSEVGDLTEADMDRIELASASDKVVAIGEIGLDHHYRLESDPSETDPPRDVQKKWFIRQLELAKKTGLPVVIHSRDASAETLDIMRTAHSEGIQGVIHCFSGSAEIAREYLKMDYYIGIGGVVTFKNGKTLKEVARITPIERILLETDCPYLAPVPHRGERNDSRLLRYVVSEIASIKNMSESDVISITERNARDMYRIGEDGRVMKGSSK